VTTLDMAAVPSVSTAPAVPNSDTSVIPDEYSLLVLRELKRIIVPHRII